MEGYARLLSKGDLPKIGSPLSRAMQAETILLDAWQIVQASIGSPATWTGEDAKTEDKAKHGYKCFGKLCIRIIHFMAKKKNAHESKEYKTMEEITLQFTKDLQAQDQTDDQKSAEEQPSSSRQQVQDAISASPSTIALLQNNHMELRGMLLGHFQNQGFSLLLSYLNIHNQDQGLLGMHVPKKVLPAQRAWKPGLPIDKHGRFGSNHDSQTHFVPRGHCPGATGPIEKVAIVQTGHASAGQSRDHGQGTATCQPPSGGRFPETQVACSANPQGLWAIQPIKKTQFKLVPLGPISKAKEGQEPKLSIQHFGAKWAIGNWKQNASLSQDHDGILVPFSWVKAAPAAEEANWQWGHLKQDGIDIPILVPKHGIDKNQQLLHEDASNMAQAKKKAKKA